MPKRKTKKNTNGIKDIFPDALEYEEETEREITIVFDGLDDMMMDESDEEGVEDGVGFMDEVDSPMGMEEVVMGLRDDLDGDAMVDEDPISDETREWNQFCDSEGVQEVLDRIPRTMEPKRKGEFLVEEVEFLDLAYKKRVGNYQKIANVLKRNPTKVRDWFVQKRSHLKGKDLDPLPTYYQNFPDNNAIPDMTSIYETLDSDDIFYHAAELQKKYQRNIDDLDVSLIIKLYNNYFTLDYRQGKSENLEVPKGDTKQTCIYSQPAKKFLQQVAAGIFTNELIEAVEGLGLKYYDGKIVAEIFDCRNKLGSSNTIEERKVKLLLSPQVHSVINSVSSFIDENYPDMDHHNRNQVVQVISHLINEPLCLDPDQMVFYVENILHYNNFKHNFRRTVKKEIPRSLIPKPIDGSMYSIQNSVMRSRKQEHSLLNYVIAKGWSVQTSDPWDEALNVYREKRGSEEQKVYSDKTQTNTQHLIPSFMNNVKKRDCVEFLRDTESVMTNNKTLLRTRTLNFQASGERIWKIEIVPIHNGKRYDCLLTPPGEPRSRWEIGGRHSTDLYVTRLKDMFTSNGQTKCSHDREIDVERWKHQQQEMAKAQTPNSASLASSTSPVNPSFGAGQQQYGFQQQQYGMQRPIHQQRFAGAVQINASNAKMVFGNINTTQYSKHNNSGPT